MESPTYFATTDLIYLGRNEDGEQDIGHAAYVVLEDAQGRRRRKHVATGLWESEVLPKAEKLASRLTARWENFQKLAVDADRWEETFPAYGSDAYSEAATAEWERSILRDGGW